MRTFIVSDLHGNGDIYDSIMGYLDNMSTIEEVELYINGDLIDRGLDSYRIFFDVLDRINGKGNVKIHYLAGNHELMMYQAMKKKKIGKPLPSWNNWILNGGRLFEKEYLDSKYPIVPLEEVHSFLGNLDIYNLFDETIKDRKLVVVHACVPRHVSKVCDLKIKDNNIAVSNALWTREENDYGFIRFRLGRDGYFAVVGHTPVSKNNKLGYFINKDYIDIDGGCSGYARGLFDYQYVPLVEVKDNVLRILTFNHNNEIVRETYYDGKDVFYVSDSFHKAERDKYIDHRYDNQAIQYQKGIKSSLKK